MKPGKISLPAESITSGTTRDEGAAFFNSRRDSASRIKKSEGADWFHFRKKFPADVSSSEAWLMQPPPVNLKPDRVTEVFKFRESSCKTWYTTSEVIESID